MYVKNKYPYKLLVGFSFIPVLIFILWSTVVVVLFHVFDCKFLTIPFLPISLIGTALSFYLGFKNNASYDRLWEARKNWADIVTDSRAWATMLNTYITGFNNSSLTENELTAIKKDLTLRHIAWLYTHKYYLRHKHQPWEHRKPINEKVRKIFHEDFEKSLDLEKKLLEFIDKEEAMQIMPTSNPAAQLLNNQTQKLKELRRQNVIEDFRLFELQNHINRLFADQSKNERIKDFPYPRQYSIMVNITLDIFAFLLPMGLLTEMSIHGSLFTWFTIPFSVLISWIFYFMETNSDYSENPFEGLAYDIPVTSITRDIEIEMLQMIGVKEIPNPIASKQGILM